jgi:hypothetical protein
MRELRLDNGHIEILQMIAERKCCEVESFPAVYKDRKRKRQADASEVAERVSELLYPEVALLKPSGDYVMLTEFGKSVLIILEAYKKRGKYQNMSFVLNKAEPLPLEEVPNLML